MNPGRTSAGARARGRHAAPPGALAFLSALADPDPAPLAACAPRLRPESVWLPWLSGQGLAPYAFFRVREVGALSLLPPALSGSLRAAFYSAAGDAALHDQELGAILEALAAVRLSPILFKGSALAYTVYPGSTSRPMGDLDLWLARETMPAALSVLQGLGYQVRAKSERPAQLQVAQDGEVQLVGCRPGQGLVELHYGVFAGEWVRRTAAVDRDGIRCRVVPLVVAGRPAWTLAPEDAVIQLAVHMAVNHQMAFPGVRGLLDVALLARACHVDWAVVAERATAWRLATVTWLVLDLAVRLFGLPAADVACDALLPSAGRRRVLGWFASPESVLAGRDLTRGPLRFVFQLVLADRWRDAARLFARALWPEAGWLTARYGRAGPDVRLRHLSGALRGKV